MGHSAGSEETESHRLSGSRLLGGSQKRRLLLSGNLSRSVSKEEKKRQQLTLDEERPV